ncbi:MAG: hypothetical protein IH985_06570 [Planctomycetes bacterium]|nr:hypothetical protein [Planctomycetota bacterium]
MPIDRILDAIWPLAGVLIGGLVTYWATRAIEVRRWNQEKKDRLAHAKREAVAKALGWLDPMDRALASVNMKVSALLHCDIDYEQFLIQFPNLISDLAKMDLPADLRLLLPADVYADGHHILRMFDEVCTEAIRWGQQARRERKPMLGLRECGQKLDAIAKQIDGLHEKLKQAYLATFE